MFSIFEEYSTAKKLLSKEFDVVFYAESGFYYQYFDHLVNALTQQTGIAIAYISSDKKDPVLNDARLETFYLRTTVAGIFPRIRAKVMIMTMPDLQQFIFKRSATVGKYIYVFHALVSTHQQYRAGAFDHYDAIFCTGPQQAEEIRKREEMRGLPAKDLIEYGYPLLQVIQQSVDGQVMNPNKILVAPSWYEGGILHRSIIPLLEELKTTGKQTWLRPHPEFVKRYPKPWKKISSMQDELLQTDLGASVWDQLCNAATLITDRSGIAFEYAFTSRRPVLYINAPRKIMNPDWEQLGIEPVEEKYRKATGYCLEEDAISSIAAAMNNLQKKEEWTDSISNAKEAMVYPPAFGNNGIVYILNCL